MADFPRSAVIGAGSALIGVLVDVYEGPARGAAIADQIETGSPSGTTNTPISTLSAVSSTTSEHYFYDFYNRIWVIPVAIDFGSVASDVQRVFHVWNAYVVPRTLGDITQFETEGLTLEGPGVPYTFKPVEMVPFDLTATVDGPPTIDARYDFNFLEGDSVSLPVVGTRSKVWPFPVNWRNPFTVTLAYKTEVMTSRSGKEQRRALRANPRKTLEFLTTVTADRYRALKRMLSSWQNKTMIVPEVTRRTRTTSVLTIGATTVSVESVPAWLRVGSLVVLYRDYGDGDLRVSLREVQAITGLDITFASVSGEVWPTDTLIHPGVSGLMVEDVRVQVPVNDTAEIQIRFEVMPGSELPEAPGLPATTFNGREIFTLTPNWVDGLDLNFIYPREQVDFGHGRVSTFRPIDFGTQTRKANFVGRTSDDVEAIADFFQRAKGQRGEFYVPSGQPDLVLMETAAEASFEFRVRGQDVLQAYQGDPVHRAIHVRMRDGREFFRAVESIYGVDDEKGLDTIVKVAVEGWPFDLAPDEILMVSWLYASRNAGDELTLEWITDSVAQVALNFRTLEDLPAEASL